MTDGESRALLLALVVPELLLFSVLALFLGLSLVGRSSFAAGYSVQIRLAALLFALLELCIPAAVYFDIRRRSDDPDMTWVHAAAVPVVNLLGVVAYLDERRRALGDHGL